jgi:hypothetical protein
MSISGGAGILFLSIEGSLGGLLGFLRIFFERKWVENGFWVWVGQNGRGGVVTGEGMRGGGAQWN